MIGWFTDITDFDAYAALNLYDSYNFWQGKTDDEKTRALNQSYQQIYYYRETDIPASPTSDTLEALRLAQSKYAGQIAVMGEGGVRRAAAIGAGVTEAGVVEEIYERISNTLPEDIMNILASAGLVKKYQAGTQHYELSGGAL